MYLYLGQDTLVREQDVVAVFDLDTATISKKTRFFLDKAQKDGLVINTNNELPKSFVLVSEKKHKKCQVYVSQIATQTLKKRLNWLDSHKIRPNKNKE